MKAFSHELQLRDLVSYITGKFQFLIYCIDYMRLVIENGKQFTSENFFMMMRELNPSQIDEYAGRFLRIMAEELGLK